MRNGTNGRIPVGVPRELPPGALSEVDVRAIVELLGDTLAHRGDDLERKRFLLEGLARLVDADAWAWATRRDGSSPNDFTCLTVIDGGFTSASQCGLATGASWTVDCQRIHDRMTGSSFTVSRLDAFSDEKWYATELYRKHREPAGLDDFLMTGMRVPQQIVSTLGFHRRLGRRRFDERERLIASIVATEVEWLHCIGIPEIGLAAVDQMSPRLHQVMLLLASGRSRKELAGELGISLHTANEYIAAVYARLGVHSRAELMARFIQGNRTADAIRPPDSGEING